MGRKTRSRRCRIIAFTLVETVIVVLTLGILAAVVGPKVFDISTTAADNSLKHTLTVVRDAIAAYSAEHGGDLPGADGQESTFKSDLEPYLRSDSPVCPVEARDHRVRMEAAGPIQGVPYPVKAWRYYYNSGEFITNSSQPTASDPTLRYDEL